MKNGQFIKEKNMGNKIKRVDDFVAGGLVRFIAFLGDLVFAYSIHFYAQSFKAYVGITHQVSQVLKTLPYFDLVNGWFWESVISVAMIYALYILIRMYTTFIFGVSFSQWLLGLRGGKGFIWNRLGGVFRCVLEIGFTPLVIFDLPPLWGMPTLKERLSVTKIIKGWGIYTYAITPFFLLFIMGLAFVAPLFFNLAIINDFKVIYKEEPSTKKISKEDDFDSFKHFSSNHFKFDVFSSLKDERFILLPNFEIVANGDARKISPSLLIFDRTYKTFGILKVAKRISLLKLLSLGKKGNPLFSMKYPVLSKAFKKTDEPFKVKTYDPKYGKNTFFSEKLKFEIKNLLEDSLKINVGNIYEHAFHNGPFINGYVQIKNTISQIIPEGITPTVTFEKIGNYEFLRFNQTFNFTDGQRQNKYETLIPMDTENAMVLEFNYSDQPTSLLSWENFKEQFWSSIVWYMDYEEIFEFPQLMEDFTPVVILDYFATRDLVDSNKKLLEDYVVDYFKSISKNALNWEDTELVKLLEVVLSRYESVISVKNLKESGYYSEEFIRKMSSIKLALTVGNKEYFK